jgi:hypothetical protein
MTTHSPRDEASTLHELLADAHARIRELEVQIQLLSVALVARTLADRRHLVLPHAERRSGYDRRSSGNGQIS